MAGAIYLTVSLVTTQRADGALVADYRDRDGYPVWTEVYDTAANGRKVLRETYEWQKRSCIGIKRVYRDAKVIEAGQIVVLE